MSEFTCSCGAKIAADDPDTFIRAIEAHGKCAPSAATYPVVQPAPYTPQRWEWWSGTSAPGRTYTINRCAHTSIKETS